MLKFHLLEETSKKFRNSHELHSQLAWQGSFCGFCSCRRSHSPLDQGEMFCSTLFDTTCVQHIISVTFMKQLTSCLPVSYTLGLSFLSHSESTSSFWNCCINCWAKNPYNTWFSFVRNSIKVTRRCITYGASEVAWGEYLNQIAAMAMTPCIQRGIL